LIEYVPGFKVEIVRTAAPFASTIAVPNTLAPALKKTVPAGAIVPEVRFTVAVKAIDVPIGPLVGEATSTVFVASAVTEPHPWLY